jgi:hypothetical protein
VAESGARIVTVTEVIEALEEVRLNFGPADAQTLDDWGVVLGAYFDAREALETGEFEGQVRKIIGEDA